MNKPRAAHTRQEIRMLGERTAWDVGFVTILGEDGIVPGVPWLRITWKFC